MPEREQTERNAIMKKAIMVMKNGRTRKIEIDLEDFPNLDNSEIITAAKKVFQAEDYLMSREEEWEKDRWRELSRVDILFTIVNCARCYSHELGDHEMNADPWRTFRQFESIILRGRQYEHVLYPESL